MSYERINPRDYIMLFEYELDDPFSAMRKIRAWRKHRNLNTKVTCSLAKLREAIRLSKYVDELY